MYHKRILVCWIVASYKGAWVVCWCISTIAIMWRGDKQFCTMLSKLCNYKLRALPYFLDFHSLWFCETIFKSKLMCNYFCWIELLSLEVSKMEIAYSVLMLCIKPLACHMFSWISKCQTAIQELYSFLYIILGLLYAKAIYIFNLYICVDHFIRLLSTLIYH